ncbi:MAG: Ldh family oxidoreductase [Thermomicrobiales bacterium]|nr:Ldh family oxidoreductase [Thermomicrobiales bacterium]
MTLTESDQGHATVAPEPARRIMPADLRRFVAGVFMRLDVPEAAAHRAAEQLVIADVRGIWSHGVARLTMYVEQIETGAILPRAELTVQRETPTTIVFNANSGLALALAPQAMDACIARAQEMGVAMVTVNNSTHFGIAGSYAMRAAARGLGGIAMTNAGPFVVPAGGRVPMLGTNPIAFSAPLGPDEPPFVFDMATSAIAYGKLENARRTGKPLAQGLVVDESGLPATDPYVAKYLMPLGGELNTSGHKGYGLAVMVETLCGPLAGALWGTHLASVQRIGVRPGLGHAFMAWRIDAFQDPAEFASELRQLLAELRATPPATGNEATGVLAPGDPEVAATVVSETRGIALHPTIWAELDELSSRLGVPLDSAS